MIIKFQNTTDKKETLKASLDLKKKIKSPAKKKESEWT